MTQLTSVKTAPLTIGRFFMLSPWYHRFLQKMNLTSVPVEKRCCGAHTKSITSNMPTTGTASTAGSNNANTGQFRFTGLALEKTIMNIVITGSRMCNIKLINKLHQITAWCKTNHHHVLTGDAHGIDLVARQDCCQLGITCNVYGAFNRFRFSNLGGHLADCSFQDYHSRDRHMVEHADMVIALWNGTSPGTRQAFQYARSLGKKTIVRTIPNLEITEHEYNKQILKCV